MKTNIFLALLLIAIFTPLSSLHANNGEQISAKAEKHIQSLATKALGFIQDDALDFTTKKAKFRELLSNYFDLKTIGRFSMGRYWRSSSEPQREQFFSLFESMVVNVYAQRFQDYSGQGFQVLDSRFDGEKDTLVLSKIVPESGAEISVDWRVRYKNGGYKVIDVIVEGVSMSVSHRSDFSAVIQRGGGRVDSLIKHLEKQASL